MQIGQKLQLRLTPLLPWQIAAINSPYTHTAMLGGIASGKSTTIAHYVINQFFTRPHLTGVIGANSHDQLSSATLRELMRWLDEYQIHYVIGKRPPYHWGIRRQVKNYNNVLTLYNPWNGTSMTAFTRIMSDPDALRGLTISWLCMDECRDTPENTFDVMLARMRESDYQSSLLCTTTNGFDWVYKRFVKDKDPNDKTFGVIRVKTIEAVNAGIVPQSFYQTLLKTYSPALAKQELFAEHVNTQSGRAYYTHTEANAQTLCPWTQSEHPDPLEPLIVGCDFNFSPAPLVWVVGQISPDGEKFHVFYEISGVELSTQDAARRLAYSAPEQFFRIYGDASGTRGQTSNAGEHDYAQIGQELEEQGCLFSIDVDPSNPLVKDRVENVCRLLQSADGTISLTYNPDRCPLLHEDLQMVGWKITAQKRNGKLDDLGDHKRTHASDALGYALFKLMPPTRRMQLIDGIQSEVRPNI